MTYHVFVVTVPGARISKVDAKLLKNGKPISMKEVEVNILDKKVVYTIKKPSRDQTGKYTIKMSNKAGESTKEVHINMQEKPSPPTNLEVSKCPLSYFINSLFLLKNFEVLLIKLDCWFFRSDLINSVKQKCSIGTQNKSLINCHFLDNGFNQYMNIL